MGLHDGALEPFGRWMQIEPGTKASDLDAPWLAAKALAHRLFVVRGLAQMSPAELEQLGSRMGRLLVFDFGHVYEIILGEPGNGDLEHPDPGLRNIDLDLHYDGLYTGQVDPILLLFFCLQAPEPGTGGETLFCDTSRVWAAADDRSRAEWSAASVAYQHSGVMPAARVPLVTRHPRTGETVLRIMAGHDRFTLDGIEPTAVASSLAALKTRLNAPEHILAHEWEVGDLLIADNGALLHGRRASRSRRHLLRVNVAELDGAR